MKNCKACTFLIHIKNFWVFCPRGQREGVCKMSTLVHSRGGGGQKWSKFGSTQLLNAPLWKCKFIWGYFVTKNNFNQLCCKLQFFNVDKKKALGSKIRLTTNFESSSCGLVDQLALIWNADSFDTFFSLKDCHRDKS